MPVYYIYLSIYLASSLVTTRSLVLVDFGFVLARFYNGESYRLSGILHANTIIIILLQSLQSFKPYSEWYPSHFVLLPTGSTAILAFRCFSLEAISWYVSVRMKDRKKWKKMLKRKRENKKKEKEIKKRN